MLSDYMKDKVRALSFVELEELTKLAEAVKNTKIRAISISSLMDDMVADQYDKLAKLAIDVCYASREGIKFVLENVDGEARVLLLHQGLLYRAKISDGPVLSLTVENMEEVKTRIPSTFVLPAVRTNLTIFDTRGFYLFNDN